MFYLTTVLCAEDIYKRIQRQQCRSFLWGGQQCVFIKQC
jgi:hypothetical protein